MSITLSNAVTNTGNTPNITTGNDANKGSATNYTFGSIFSAIDTANLYQSDGASWVNLSGGGGGTNPTPNFLPFNNAGTFADAPIYWDTQFNILYSGDNSFFGNSGFSIDFMNNIYKFGDFGSSGGPNPSHLEIQYGSLYTICNGKVNGLSCSLPAYDYTFGDATDFNIGFQMEYNSALMKTYFNNIVKGFNFNFNTNDYWLGDFDNQSVALKMSYNSKETFFYYDGNKDGIWFDYNNGNYYFGEFTGIANSTHIYLQDGAEAINFNSQSNSFSINLNNSNTCLGFSSNFITTNNGTAINQHLKINVGGTDYVIQLRLA